MRKLDSAEIAAVVVMRSRWTSSKQRRYVASVAQPSPVGHTQVPPESERIEALTEIYEDKEIRQGGHASARSIYDGGRTMYAIAAWVRVINWVRRHSGINPTYPRSESCTDLCLNGHCK